MHGQSEQRLEHWPKDTKHSPCGMITHTHSLFLFRIIVDNKHPQPDPHMHMLHMLLLELLKSVTVLLMVVLSESLCSKCVVLVVHVGDGFVRSLVNNAV